MGFLAVCRPYFEKYFGPLSISVKYFLSGRDIFCILDINLLSDMVLTNISSHCMNCLCVLLIVFLINRDNGKSSSSVFTFITVLWVSSPRNH